MKNFYFSIFMIIALAAVSLTAYYANDFFSSYSKSVSGNLEANLMSAMLQEKIIESAKKENFDSGEEIKMMFVGDIMLDRGVAGQIKKSGDFKFPFLNVADNLRQADLTVGNLEGPISFFGENQHGLYSFRFDPGIMEGLKYSGFDILSLANNHIFDYGRGALIDTISILKENNIESIGAGRNYFEANNPLIKEIEGTKIAFLAFTEPIFLTNSEKEFRRAKDDEAGLSFFDVNNIKKEISWLKNNGGVDIVVVSIHWGDEYQSYSKSKQKETGRALIETGADLIVGHHPHVAQEIEQIIAGSGKRAWIAYSLGNFIFDQHFSKETMRGIILDVMIKNKKIVSVLPIDIKINSHFQPEVVK